MKHPITRTHKCLGSVWSITIIGTEKDARWCDICFEEAERFEQKYSRFLSGNYLEAINTHLHTWQDVDAETWELLTFAKEVYDRTHGAFDISVASVLEAAGYDRNYSLTPQKKPGTHGMFELDRQRGQVFLTAPIEFGGFGKGWMLDTFSRLIAQELSVFISGGGDIYARGHDEKGNPWRIHLEDPSDPTRVLGFFDVTDGFAASSAGNRRRWGTWHHLIHPQTQSPACDMLAVYTQGRSGAMVDACATSLFVLGFEEAQKRLPELPVEAALLSPKGEVYTTHEYNIAWYT